MAGAGTGSLRDIVEAVSSQLREQDMIVDANRRAVAVLEEDNVRTLCSLASLTHNGVHVQSWVTRQD
jgi:intracellular sulfur oxidation DsrE/DsrF family protein